MSCYCGYNLWSVDCGCIIRRSINSLKVSMYRYYDVNTYTVLSTCGYFWTLSILCTSCLCDCLLLHHDRPPTCGKLLFYIRGYTKSSTEHKQKYCKVVVGLTIVFMISYVPYHVVWTYIVCSKTVSSPTTAVEMERHWNYKLKYMYLISTRFLLINSYLNPVALFCTSSRFRQHLKRYLTCFCKTNSPPTDFELTKKKLNM